jgi:hypothetical protein
MTQSRPTRLSVMRALSLQMRLLARTIECSISAFSTCRTFTHFVNVGFPAASYENTGRSYAVTRPRMTASASNVSRIRSASSPSFAVRTS